MKSIAVCVTFLVLGIVVADNKWDCIENTKLDKNPMECCKFPKLTNYDVAGACFSEFGPKGPHVRGDMPPACCISECILNRTNVYHDGIIDKAAAQEFFAGKINDPQWSGTLTKALDTCDDEVKNNPIPNPNKADANGNTCNPISGQFILCIHRELFLNCPNVDPSCKSVQEVVKACPFILLKAHMDMKH